MKSQSTNKVAIVDYGMCNLFSVEHACQHVGLKPVITADKETILSADGLILPGVGAFGEAMSNLQKLDLIAPIKDFVASGKPFLGICLGMQLLMSGSEEFGNHYGLDIVAGTVVKFSETIKETGQQLKVPHVGWCEIYAPKRYADNWKLSLLKHTVNNEYMYFVHSYYAVPEGKATILSLSRYADTEFCSSIAKENIFASQFHPEKSGKEGLKIYKNWAQILSFSEGIKYESKS